jgi:hypothetical protein
MPKLSKIAGIEKTRTLTTEDTKEHGEKTGSRKTALLHPLYGIEQARE